MQEISARDLDILNNQVTFSSVDSGFITVGTADRVGADGKTFYATLRTTQQILTINGQIEFTIIGTVREIHQIQNCGALYFLLCFFFLRIKEHRQELGRPLL